MRQTEVFGLITAVIVCDLLVQPMEAIAQQVTIHFQALFFTQASLPFSRRGELTENKIAGVIQVNAKVEQIQSENFFGMTLRDDRTYKLASISMFTLDVNSETYYIYGGDLSGYLSITFDESSRKYKLNYLNLDYQSEDLNLKLTYSENFFGYLQENDNGEIILYATACKIPIVVPIRITDIKMEID